jgi:hypothetical protein
LSGNVSDQQKGDGLSVDFLKEFIQVFAARSIGADMSSINFENVDDASLIQDETLIKEIFEMLLHTVNTTDAPQKKIKEADLGI